METNVIERPVSRRELRKQDRREAIVAAARHSFLENGYAATSMSGLLKTLGGSKATLWSYFRSKEELFAAVIEDVTRAFRRELESDLSKATGLRPTLISFCRRFMEKTANPEMVATWRLVLAESGRFPIVGMIFYERGASHVERALSQYLAEQVRHGRLRDDEPLIMAQILISMCATQQNKLLWGIQQGEARDIDAEAGRFADFFMRLFGPIRNLQDALIPRGAKG